jgi:hypothetical protein
MHTVVRTPNGNDYGAMLLQASNSTWQFDFRSRQSRAKKPTSPSNGHSVDISHREFLYWCLPAATAKSGPSEQ